MSSMKDIRSRISNVSTTKQIIKAMDMVAARRLHKARLRLEGIRPLYQELSLMAKGLEKEREACGHMFAVPRPVKNTAYVVITSNKGLCGSFNADVSAKALEHMNDGRNEKIVVLGSKGGDYFRRRGKNILYRVADMSEARIYENAGRLGELVTSLYVSGQVDEIYVAYTYFESTLTHVPRLERLLPMMDGPAGTPAETDMKYDPDVVTFIDHFVPLYLHMYFFAASAESATCEHAARMINMDSAGKNASDIIDDLNRMYNRKRQAAITQELNEIVGSAGI